MKINNFKRRANCDTKERGLFYESSYPPILLFFISLFQHEKSMKTSVMEKMKIIFMFSHFSHSRSFHASSPSPAHLSGPARRRPSTWRRLEKGGEKRHERKKEIGNMKEKKK